MDWLKKNYDKAILGALALALLVCAALIFLSSSSFSQQFERQAVAPNNEVPAAPTQELLVISTVVSEPSKWMPHDGSLFVSRPYVLQADGSLVDPLDKDGTPLHPPITNKWLDDNKLNYWESDIKEQDPDEDRFSNFEEFTAGTDPRDAKSIPAYYTKLRLVKFTPEPLLLTFQGTPDEGESFQINTRVDKTKRGKTQFLKLGDTIEGLPYKILSYEKKSGEKDGIEVDTSELTVENTEKNYKIVLVANKEANDPTSYGDFIYLYDDSTHRWKKDDTFTLAPETDRKYKLIDISEQEAVIQDLGSGEKHTVPRLE